MTACGQLDTLCARLTMVLDELEGAVPADHPGDLAFVEDQVAALCRGLSDLPTAERPAALAKLQSLAAQLGKIEHRLERNLADLNQRIGAAGPPANRSGD